LKKHEETKPTLPAQQPSQNSYNTGELEKQATDLQTQIKSEKKRKKADKLNKQLAEIEKQIAESRRQQQLIAVVQTAAQAFMNKQRQPASVNTARNTQAVPMVNSTATNTAKPEQSKGGGSSWGLIFLLVAGVVIIILWRRSNSTPVTNYRL
jgi:hypothetical protein